MAVIHLVLATILATSTTTTSTSTSTSTSGDCLLFVIHALCCYSNCALVVAVDGCYYSTTTTTTLLLLYYHSTISTAMIASC